MLFSVTEWSFYNPSLPSRLGRGNFGVLFNGPPSDSNSDWLAADDRSPVSATGGRAGGILKVVGLR